MWENTAMLVRSDQKYNDRYQMLYDWNNSLHLGISRGSYICKGVIFSSSSAENPEF